MLRIIAVSVTASFVLAACSSESEYQRPRSEDQPQIYANHPPVGSMRWN
jgi:hypothetical protein